MPNIWKTDAQGDPYLDTQKTRGRKAGSGAIPPAVVSLRGKSQEIAPPIEIIPKEGASVNELITTSLQNFILGFPLDELSKNILERHGYNAQEVASNPEYRSTIATSIIDKLQKREAEEHLKLGKPIGRTTSGQGSVTDAASGERDKYGTLRHDTEI